MSLINPQFMVVFSTQIAQGIKAARRVLFTKGASNEMCDVLDNYHDRIVTVIYNIGAVVKDGFQLPMKPSFGGYPGLDFVEDSNARLLTELRTRQEGHVADEAIKSINVWSNSYFEYWNPQVVGAMDGEKESRVRRRAALEQILFDVSLEVLYLVYDTMDMLEDSDCLDRFMALCSGYLAGVACPDDAVIKVEDVNKDGSLAVGLMSILVLLQEVVDALIEKLIELPDVVGDS
jgi:hypothetical protein